MTTDYENAQRKIEKARFYRRMTDVLISTVEQINARGGDFIKIRCGVMPTNAVAEYLNPPPPTVRARWEWVEQSGIGGDGEEVGVYTGWLQVAGDVKPPPPTPNEIVKKAQWKRKYRKLRGKI